MNSNTTTSPFHKGEQYIQDKLGVRERMEPFGRQVIRKTMPEQHQQFYAQLPFVFVGHADQYGWPWASILFNQPGFMQSNDSQHLQINALPVTGDPLNNSLQTGNRLGLLGIELTTRRRNRLSTHIHQLTESSIELTVDQAFGNCPQYIQNRTLEMIDPETMSAPETIERVDLDQQAMDLISRSDTFFVASYVANGSGAISEGADVSHRGGKPGFIRVDNNQSLTIPDFLGNFHFNTLGNFQVNNKAGLLFIDFNKGHILTLTGTVEILWDSPDTEFFAGAERLWRFQIDHGRWLKNALPLRWVLQDYSANTLLTGSWQEADAAKKAGHLKSSWQPYTVAKIVSESSVTKSFYLQPPENQHPQFKPGQFLTLKADINGTEQIRTYTLSSAPGDDLYRISIKHEQGKKQVPSGVFSSFMHKHIEVGSIIDTKAPTGAFTFNTSSDRTAVLIAAGIGITPMLAIARHVLQQAIRTRHIQPLILICSARNHAQRAFYDELNDCAKNADGYIQIYWALSQPEENLRSGADFQHTGRIDSAWLQTLLPESDYDVYLCGPNSFMQNLYDMLRENDIEDNHIFTEAFGPATLKRDINSATQLPIANAAIVTFSESKLEQVWSKSDGNLLEFAEAHGLTPAYGCRSGQCASCKVKLLKGRVTYPTNISAPTNSDEVLLCSAMPTAETDESIAQLKLKM